MVLTCLEQQQRQQQAGAHGQVAATLGCAGVQPRGCRASRGAVVLSNLPSPLPGFIYTWLRARLQRNTLFCEVPSPSTSPVCPAAGSLLREEGEGWLCLPGIAFGGEGGAAGRALGWRSLGQPETPRH